MSNRFAPTLLWTLGLLAFVGSSFVLYNFVVNDWRLEGDILSPESLRSFLGGDRPEEETSRVVAAEFPLDDNAAVDIDAALCTISIVPSTGRQASVRFLLSGDATDSTLYHTATRTDSSRSLQIFARPSSGWDASSQGFVEIEISLPATASVSVRLQSGNLSLDRLRSGVRVEMTDGELRGTALAGEISIRNGSGSISLERCTGRGVVELSSGNVHLLYNDGDLIVSAADSIDARAHFGRLEATTISGAIVAEMFSSTPACRLQSDAGSITVKLLPGSRASIGARSQFGTITHSLPLDLPDSIAVQDYAISSPFNGGGDSVVAVTRSGEIRLEEYGNRVRMPRFQPAPEEPAEPELDSGSLELQ